MTREKMIRYLDGHFRYWTMNSWNRSESYACNVKIHHMKWRSSDLETKAYDFLEISEAFAGTRRILRNFGERHSWGWQIAFNGRSGGYLVLYQGGFKEHEIAPADMKPGSRDYGDYVGRWFSYDEAVAEGWLGRKYKQVFTKPGCGTDMDEDFHEWETDVLRRRCRLVMDFDRTCMKAVKSFQDFVERHETRMVEVPETRTVKMAFPIKNREVA